MFVLFARPLFACHSNTARPRIFLSVYKFSGDNIFVHQSPFTQSQQPVFQINDDMVLAHHFRVEIEFFHRMTRTYIMEPFHRQLAFRMEFIGIWKYLFPFTNPSPALFFCCLTFKHFIIIRLIKKSNYVAVLVFTCCAAPISLRVVDSLRHTHAFSRVTLREFLVKWATMAAPMISENVRFKINFMVYNILTKLNKKYIYYNILSWMVCGN